MRTEGKKAKFEESDALTHALIIILLYAEPKALSSALASNSAVAALT